MMGVKKVYMYWENFLKCVVFFFFKLDYYFYNLCYEVLLSKYFDMV